MRLGLKLIVVGSGGHAKVVISSLLASGWGVCAVYDDDSKKWDRSIMGIPVTGPVEKLSESDRLPAVIAVGDGLFRQQIAERYDRDWVTVIHPRAYVDASATLGAGTVVFAGAVIQPGVTIGSHAIINTSASIDHDCLIDDYAHVAPGAHLAANVHVLRGAFLGTGAQVIPGITIGEYSIVGAGSTVIRNIPDHVAAVGCPAKVIKANKM
jgi:sugar O-acyltransferase (sialic acid O-acetyltransferase NeuD family)